RVSRDGEFSNLAVDEHGIATAAWTLYAGGDAAQGVELATAAAGRHFGATQRQRSNGAWDPRVAVSPRSRRRLVVWRQNAARGDATFLVFAGWRYPGPSALHIPLLRRLSATTPSGSP